MMNVIDNHYCLRKWWGKVASIWILDESYTYIGYCQGAMARNGKNIIVFPDKGKSFIMAFEAFVPVYKVRCLWESQVYCINEEAKRGELYLPKPLPESVESMKKRNKVGKDNP